MTTSPCWPIPSPNPSPRYRLTTVNEDNEEETAISYYTDEGLTAPRLREKILEKWIRDTAEAYGRQVGELCYQFCSDERILETNQAFLDHDYYTDIITFDDTVGEVISGDMLISLDTVASNAEMLEVSFEQELHRVLIHGVLHLCGLKDKSPEDEAAMRAAEDRALSHLTDLIGSGKSLFS